MRCAEQIMKVSSTNVNNKHKTIHVTLAQHLFQQQIVKDKYYLSDSRRFTTTCAFSVDHH
jgi:hypothetical protein